MKSFCFSSLFSSSWNSALLLTLGSVACSPSAGTGQPASPRADTAPTATAAATSATPALGSALVTPNPAIPAQPGAAAPPPAATAPPAPTPASGAQSTAAQGTAAQDTAAQGTAAQAEAAPSTGPCPPHMAHVPGGAFQRAGTRGPQPVPDLCVDELETTAAEYAQCVEVGACSSDGLSCSAQSTFDKPDKASHPITCVTFEQAKTYCAHHGKRLPTVDEWEWVARGGEAARPYPWGDAAPEAQLCWTGKAKQIETCPVGSFPDGASLHGIKDLAGNVLEFTTTAWDESSPTRMVRGGAWREGVPYLFKTSRLGGVGIDYRCGFLGIRCVQPAKPEGTPPADATPRAATP